MSRTPLGAYGPHVSNKTTINAGSFGDLCFLWCLLRSLHESKPCTVNRRRLSPSSGSAHSIDAPTVVLGDRAFRPAATPLQFSRAITRICLFLLRVPFAACGDDAAAAPTGDDVGTDGRDLPQIAAMRRAPYALLIALISCATVTSCGGDGSASEAVTSADAGDVSDGDATADADDAAEESDTDDAASDLNSDAAEGDVPDTVADSELGNEPTCEDACELVADCLVDLCDGFGERARPQLSATCAEQCTPELAEQFATQTCEENVAAITSANPTAAAACDEPEPEPGDGLNALYIGHSFGRPFAEDLTGVASDAGIDHSQNIVFSGGASGAPQALWDDVGHRTEIQGLLDGGDIDVLIMICCSESFIEDGTEPAIRLWMDYALAQNPDTAFALSMLWIDFPESYADSTEYGDLWHEAHGVWHELIASLREDYPGVEINCLPHGHAAVELRHIFEAGELSEVDELRRSNRDNEGIFTDEKGHADDILRDLGGLIWLRSLYDVDLTGHPIGEDYETDLIGLAERILAEDDYVR